MVGQAARLGVRAAGEIYAFRTRKGRMVIIKGDNSMGTPGVDSCYWCYRISRSAGPVQIARGLECAA
jgi:hypothetical protein